MRINKIFFLLLMLIFCAYLPVGAKTLVKKTGAKIEGELVKLENNIVVVKTDKGEVKVPLNELDDDSQYAVRAFFADDENPAEHTKLAQFCFERELYEQAIAEATKANEQAEKITMSAYKIVKKARLCYADALLQKANKLKQDRQYVQALKLFITLYREYPEIKDRSKIAAEITLLQGILGRPKVLPKVLPLPALLQKDSNNDKKKPVKPANKNVPKLSHSQKNRLKLVKRKLAEAKKEIEGAIALRTKTLRDLDPEKDFSTIVKNYEKCEKNFKEALATLKAFEQLDTKKEPWLAEYVEKAKRTATLAYDGLIEVAKDMMTLYSTVSSKSSFRLAALRWVNKVLSYSPYDKDARDLRKLLTEQIVKEANR